MPPRRAYGGGRRFPKNSGASLAGDRKIQPNGSIHPPILTVNEEALCWVQRSYANQDLKAELAKVLAR